MIARIADTITMIGRLPPAKASRPTISVLPSISTVDLTIMMLVPLILLYELSIILSAGIYGRRVKREQELEASLTPPPGAVEAQ